MNIQINKFPKVLPNQPVSIDLEIFEAKKEKLHSPKTGRFACLSLVTSSETCVITDQELVRPAMKAIEPGIWVLFNAKFDLTHLRRWADIPPRRKLWDLMLIEQIMWNGFYNRFSLKDLCRRYLHKEVSKEVREQFEFATELTPELIEYSGKDGELNLAILQEQKKQVSPADWKVWTKIELPMLWVILDMMPFRLDVDAWTELAKSNREYAEELKSSLGFNPNSPKQVLDVLRKGGFKHLPSTGEDVLVKYSAKYPNSDAAKIAQNILAARQASKAASTYGEKWITEYVEKDDIYANDVYVIRSNWKQAHAETSRMASDSPNLQNIPSRATKAFRKCFIPRPGNVIIVADFSQQEPRITAFLAKDEKMLKAVIEEDVYCALAAFVYGEKIDKHDPRRKKIKAVILGIEYGMSAQGLADREGITLDEAEDIIKRLLRAFPGLKRYMDKQRKAKSKVETLAGRTLWLNPYSSSTERNALNAPIQGTAAEITKMAAILCRKNWIAGIPFGLVAIIHDELVFDVPKERAEELAEIIRQSMIDAAKPFCPGVPFDAEVFIGDSWGVKE